MRSMRLPHFSPHPLLRSGHLQTILGQYWPEAPIHYAATQRLVELPDGDKIVVHDDCPASWASGDLVVVMIHGLGGCHLSGYMARIADKLNARGVRTLRMDQRGFGSGSFVARSHTHAGRSGDLDAVLRFTERLCPRSKRVAIGFSMGANILLKLLGEYEEAPRPSVHSAIAVAPPIDLYACSENLKRGPSRIYDLSFVRTLNRLVEMRRRKIVGMRHVELRPKPKRLFEFDDRYTAPLAGFSGAKEYYQKSSCSPLLGKITIPTTIIADTHDPVVPYGVFTRTTLSKSTNLITTSYGGHIGYVGKTGCDPDRRWLDWRVVELVCDVGL